MGLDARLVQIAAMVATAAVASGCGESKTSAPTDQETDGGITCSDGWVPPRHTLTAAQACEVLEQSHGDGMDVLLTGPGCQTVCAGYSGCVFPDPTFLGAVQGSNPGVGPFPLAADAGFVTIKNCPTNPPTTVVQCEEVLCK
jgi:hypothetical protein